MVQREEIGGYRLIRCLGHGGMASVYEAQDAAGNHVAFKLLHPSLADSAGRERLNREVAMLLRVKGSRVAQVLDAEIDGEDAFIVTELIDGLTLERDVAENGVYEGDELVDLADALTQAVHSIHFAGVLHRDLKPANVMLGEGGPVLIDFGIAQLGDDVRLTTVGSLAQTPGYCDPRVVQGAQPDKGADWWALAAVLLFAATGRSPFGTGTHDAILKRVLDGHADVAGLDEPIAQAFLAALAPNGRIETDTLTEILRHPQKAQELLPPRSENATEILSYEQTRVYETISAQSQPHGHEQPQEQVEPTVITELTEEIPFITPEEVEGVEGITPRRYEEDNGEAIYRGDGLAEFFDDSDDETLESWAKPAPKSSWLVLLCGLILSVYGSVWVGACLFLYVLFLVLCSTWGFLSGELRERRLEHGGVYAHDKLGVFVRSPWAFLRAILMTLVSMLVGAAAFALTLFLLRTFLADVPLISQSSGDKLPLPYSVFAGVSFFVFLCVSWFLPTNKRGREGVGSFLYSLAPSMGYKFFWTIIFMLGIGIGCVLVHDASSIEWFPFPDISSAFPGLFGS